MILGQCTEFTCMQLEWLPDWEASDDSSDDIKLPKMIKILSHQDMDQKYYPLSLYKEIKSVYCLQQWPMMMNSQLVDKLKDRAELVEEIKGPIGSDPKIIED